MKNDTVESRLNNATDYAIINAVAKAWVDAGGDTVGFEFCWHHVRDRIEEIESRGG